MMAAEVPTKLWVERPPVVCHARFDDNNDAPKTLHYFAIQGLGELPRLCLEYTQTPYDSVMYFGTPNIYKEFAPFGQLPCYQDPDAVGESVYVAQSAAICRHIARETGIDGSNGKERALQDMLWEAGKDVLDKKSSLHASEADTKLEGILNGLIALQEAEDCLVEGKKLGYGEIGVFHALHTFHCIKPDFLDRYLGLKKFVDMVVKIPAIDNYLNSPRRLPLTKNEVGLGNTGLDGYAYISEANPATFAEIYFG